MGGFELPSIERDYEFTHCSSKGCSGATGSPGVILHQNVSHSRQDEWWHVAGNESSKTLARISGQLATCPLLARGTTSAGLACRVSLLCVNRLVILEHQSAAAEREWAENPALYQRELARESAMYPPWLIGWEILEHQTGMSIAIHYVSAEEFNTGVKTSSSVLPRSVY